MTSDEPKAVIPYIGIDRIIETLRVIYKRGSTEIPATELASLLGSGPSSINNVTPTLGLLGLANVKKGLISITSEGLEFIRAYNSNEIEKAKQIIRKSVLHSEVLKFVNSLLETRVQLTGEEIGRALADRFGKKWKNVISYRAFGNSCASIVSFGGFGFYHDGVLSLKAVTLRAGAELFPPEVGFNPIIDLLNALHPFERVKGSDLARKLKAKEGRVATELSVCVALGLVDRDSTGGYRITDKGRKLVDPLLHDPEKKQAFRECLLSSPYREVISKLSEADELTDEIIGESLAYFMRRDWSPITKKLYGRKFITWLNGSGLLKKAGRNKYQLSTDQVRKSIRTQEETKTKPVDVANIYEVGRVLGILETIIPNAESRKDFEDQISVLKVLLTEHSDFQLTLDLLRKNFQVSIRTKDPSIYKSNVEFIKQKVMERLGIKVVTG
jgi:hypothetical protein